MAIVFPLCLAYAVYCLVTLPAGPITTPDSAHYLSFSPIVPLGYPIFLSLVGARGAIIAQPVLYAAALALLGRETIRATGHTVLAVASLAALAAHGSLLFTALLAAGFSRFMLGVWPAIMTAMLFGGYWALRLGRPLRSTNF